MTERKASLACGHAECVTGLPCKRQAPEYWARCMGTADPLPCLWCGKPAEYVHPRSLTESVGGCEECKPRPVTGDGRMDERYSVSVEYTGHTRPEHVTRFCDEYIGWHMTEAGAWQSAVVHAQNRGIMTQPGFTEGKRND